MFATFIAQHNIAFAAADHFSKMVPLMFPDSAIAKKYSAAKTKTTQIIKRMYTKRLSKLKI